MREKGPNSQRHNYIDARNAKASSFFSCLCCDFGPQYQTPLNLFLNCCSKGSFSATTRIGEKTNAKCQYRKQDRTVWIGSPELQQGRSGIMANWRCRPNSCCHVETSWSTMAMRLKSHKKELMVGRWVSRK